MDLSRRRFIKWTTLSTLPCSWRFADATQQSPTVFSSISTSNDEHWWVCQQFSQDFGPPATLAKIRLPARGHATCVSPSGEKSVLVGRRPATWMVAMERSFDTLRPRWITVQEERHFLGHAVFSQDEKFLYATENSYQEGRGVIGVYRTVDYQRIGELASGGIGPHELRLMPDGKQLMVANGGILTHSSRPREKLNLDRMQPNLSRIELSTGRITGQWYLGDRLLSIRHLDIDAQGDVWVGCQYQATLLDPIPLVARLRRQSNLEVVQATPNQWRKLNGYCGSVACHPALPLVAVSSPRGDHILFWHIDDRELYGMVKIRDVCGIAMPADRAECLASNGKGELYSVSLDKSLEIRLIRHSPLKWDNHLTTA